MKTPWERKVNTPINQDPIVNTWYTNLTGQLFKVRFVMFVEGQISHIMIEYVNGNIQTINHGEWECLKLVKHTYARKQSPEKEFSF